jgi:hypothetical protein
MLHIDCYVKLLLLLPFLLLLHLLLAADLFASSFPTVVMYVIDTPRCTAPQTFMSNMLQAVSILYKTKLPMLLVRRQRVQ